MDPYLTAKWLHILSSTVLFGTGIGTAFQMVWAMRSGEVRAIHTTARGVVMADWIFTTPAGIIQPVTGVWLVWLQGYSLTEPWLIVTYALYSAAFACWAPVVKLQIRIRDLTAKAAAIQAASLANIEQLEDAITAANEEGVNTHTANKVCALRSWLPVHPTNSRATVIESPAPGLVGMASCQCVQPLPVTPRGVLGQYC